MGASLWRFLRAEPGVSGDAGSGHVRLSDPDAGRTGRTGTRPVCALQRRHVRGALGQAAGHRDRGRPRDVPEKTRDRRAIFLAARGLAATARRARSAQRGRRATRRVRRTHLLCRQRNVLRQRPARFRARAPRGPFRGHPGMSKTVALVTGVGPGTGSAIVRRFAQGPYEVAMIARSGERLRELAHDIPGTHAFAADVTDTHQMGEVLGRITRELGAPEIVIHNAVGGAFANFQEIDPAVLERNFQVNVMALLHLVRRTAPAMIEAGRGAIIVTGNTSALRGKANFAGFAPSKAAQRVLTESIARELGPKGIHVAYIVIDAVIDVAWTRKMRPDAPDDFFIQPRDIAAEVWHVAHQPRSAWSFNVEIRPFGEQW